MNKTILLGIVLVLLVLPFVSGNEASYHFEKDTTTDLKVPCVTETNTYCADSTTCTITVNYPNGSNLINNASMNFTDSYFNFTLNSSAINTNGLYFAAVNCIGESDNGFTTFYFRVTETGKEVTDDGTFSGIMIGVVLLGITLLFSWLSVAYKENRPWQIFFFLFFFFMIVVDFRFVSIITESINSVSFDSTLQSNLVGNLDMLYRIFLPIFVVILILSLVYVFFTVIKSFNPRKRAEMLRAAEDNEFLMPK